MPKYLSFDATKDIRDRMLNRTLDPVYGRSPSPKTFKSDDYSIQTLSDSPNLLLPQLDANRSNDLLIPQKSNVFKPTEYFIKDSINDIPRKANLNLYPYFIKSEASLISIMTTNNYDTESELFKFAAHNIRTNNNGPVLARISQNLYTATNAKNKIGEALAGNTNTLINIIRGKQPLIEGNESITVSSSLLGKGFDFLVALNRSIKPGQVTEIAKSINKMGVIRPIVVAKFTYLGKQGNYIIDGQHLYHALLRNNSDFPYVEITVNDDADLVEKKRFLFFRILTAIGIAAVVLLTSYLALTWEIPLPLSGLRQVSTG